MSLSLVALKKIFLNEKDPLKRAAIIFMISKIFFTDETANLLKLRTTCDEWEVFKKYLEEIKSKPEYLSIQIMFYQLQTENFFLFTVRNKALALDYGSVDNDMEVYTDGMKLDEILWREIKHDLRSLEQSEIDLKQLNSIREEAMKPFDKMFPEKDLLAQALTEFSTVKAFLTETKKPTEPVKVSRKEVSQACREFLKTSGGGSMYKEVEVEELEWNSDLEPTTSEISKISRRKRPKVAPKRIKAPASPCSSSSDSEAEKDFLRMNRSLGYHSQNVMKGIGAIENMSNKLKQCYGE